MKQSARSYYSANEKLAEQLVIEGLRAPIVKRISHVPQALVTRFYQQYHNRNSPSGQMPTSLTWYAENYTVSFHSALVATLYLQMFERLKSNFPTSTREDVTAHAFCRTLAVYNSIVGESEPVLTPARAWALVQHFADKAAFIRNASAPDSIKIMKCSACSIPLVVRSHFREITCEHCQSARSAKKPH